MMLKELHTYREVDEPDDLPVHEYLFLKAYLKVIDEVNNSDHGDIDLKTLDPSDSDHVYKVLWMPMISQFEYNERGNIIFETLKTACLLNMAKENYLPYLQEYLALFGFKSPGELLRSFDQIYAATTAYDIKEKFRKYTLINTEDVTNTRHLDYQLINQRIGKRSTFSDLKKMNLTLVFSSRKILRKV